MIQAINWNKKNDSYTQIFFEQNQQQYWRETAFSMARDVLDYKKLTPEQKTAFNKVFAGLTFLDSNQGAEGMPLIGMHVEDGQKKAVLSWMGMMEHIHAKSYSYIFTSLLSKKDIDEVFHWAETNPLLQEKGELINQHYRAIFKPQVTPLELYKAMVASVALENIQFYSGFFYALYLGGTGVMRAASEIITMILKDESIHGQFVGILAQEQYLKLTPEERVEADAFREQLFRDVYDVEARYTRDIYDAIGFTDQVLVFIEYNMNKACDNLGVDRIFEARDINPIVEAGLKTTGGTHDFFSTKGKNYVVTQNIVEVSKEDFEFNGLEDILDFIK